eukprot:gnl/TRDRNA2_/TRDRNA2_167942_c0_seq6.p1 gnl/TRDRNA2_/TRDRNA2_167942_c0~~gnl/TRDRNA2_/TRDRNA2_167942_c0_seq6.p1  ORF type:complete len:211 (-),score=39.37 gnl/TRDRNA2_/TRDRNA2_167942_c0_seq6:21-617(-)
MQDEDKSGHLDQKEGNAYCKGNHASDKVAVCSGKFHEVAGKDGKIDLLEWMAYKEFLFWDKGEGTEGHLDKEEWDAHCDADHKGKGQAIESCKEDRTKVDRGGKIDLWEFVAYRVYHYLDADGSNHLDWPESRLDAQTFAHVAGKDGKISLEEWMKYSKFHFHDKDRSGHLEGHELHGSGFEDLDGDKKVTLEEAFMQ